MSSGHSGKLVERVGLEPTSVSMQKKPADPCARPVIGGVYRNRTGLYSLRTSRSPDELRPHEWWRLAGTIRCFLHAMQMFSR